MSHLRLIYHYRKIAAASGADHEAAFYQPVEPWPWSDDFVATDLGPGWSQQYAGIGAGFSLCDGDQARWFNTPMAMPTPPEGWRTVGPADCNVYGQMFYAMELADLARDHPDFRDGCCVYADYRRVDGEWFPVIESLRVIP